MLNNGLLKNSSFSDDNMSLVDDIDETSVNNENLITKLKETFKNNEYDYNFDKDNKELDNLKDTEMEINDLKLTYTNKGNKEETKIENISFEKQILPLDNSQKQKLIISSIGIVESINNCDQSLIIKESINKENLKIQNENKDEFKDKVTEKKKIYSNEKIDINCEKIILNEKNKNESKSDIILNTNPNLNSYNISTTVTNKKNDITPIHNSNKYGLLMKSINQNEKSTNNDNPQDQNFISTKLNQTEKEYFNLKQIFSENMLNDGTKNNLDGEKTFEFLNRQNNELKKYHEKFTQIEMIMKSVEYLEVNNKPKQNKNQAIEKTLETYLKQHNFLTLRMSILTSENYESSLDTILLETVNEINHFEIQNRVSRHSKKKSEIKFNKTQKLSNSIDSKKINNDYNVSKQESDNLNKKINKNKKLIEENELKITNFKEDLSKLKEIAEFYGITELDMKYLFVNSIIDLNNPNDVDFITSKKTELMKKYEGLNKKKEANFGNFEKNKLQLMNYIKELDIKKHDIMILIKEKMIKAEAENEKVKELYYLKQNCKNKNICDKNSEIIRNCKKDKLDTIDERENEDLCKNNKNVEIIKESDNFAEIIIENDKITEIKVENKDENDNKNEKLDTNLKENFVKEESAQNVKKDEEILIKKEEILTNSNELLSAAQEEINKIKGDDQVTEIVKEKSEKLNVEIEINETKNDEIPEIKTNRDIIEFENKAEIFEKQENSPKNIRTNLYLADKSQEDKENTFIIKENIQFKKTKIEVSEDNLTKINPVEIQNKYKRDSVNKENSDKKNVEKKEDALLFIKDYTPKYADETILNIKENNKKENLNTNSSAQVKNKKIESKKKNPTNFEQKSLFSDVFNEGEDDLIIPPKENKQINQKRKDFDQLFQSDITSETIKIPTKNLNNHTSQRNEKPTKTKTKTIDDLDDLIL